MSRWEYMRRLEELLSDIPPSEREEALQYYNDYINDGGKENEADILESLGTPDQVAATIKEGLDGSGGEFTEKGFRGVHEHNSNTLARYQQPVASSGEETQKEKKEKLSGGVIALIVIACVFGSPFILSLAGVALSVIICIFASILVLVVTFAAVAIGLIAIAIVLLILGIPKMFVSPLTGLGLIAMSLIVAGIGILFLLGTTSLVGRLIPALIKGISSLFNRILNRQGGEK